MIAVVAQRLPALALVALLSAPLSWRAARDTLRWSAQPQKLATAIRLTIAAALMHGMLMALALAGVQWVR